MSDPLAAAKQKIRRLQKKNAQNVDPIDIMDAISTGKGSTEALVFAEAFKSADFFGTKTKK